MDYPELEPLIRKAGEIKNFPEANDIYEGIVKEASAASNSFMAHQVCRRVISMCHPKAWGDRFVKGFDSNVEWMEFLVELSDIANVCGEALNRREQKK